MLPCKLNWNNISLWGFLEFWQTVNCNKWKRLQNAIYICFRINPNRWNAKTSFQKYTPKIQQTFLSAKINSTKCAKFCIFDLFHYLSKVSNNNLYRIRKKNEQIKLKKQNKQIVTGSQTLKTLNITHCTLQKRKVGYAYNAIVSYLTFVSSTVLLRRGN